MGKSNRDAARIFNEPLENCRILPLTNLLLIVQDQTANTNSARYLIPIVEASKLEGRCELTLHSPLPRYSAWAGKRQLAEAQPYWESAEQRLRRKLGDVGWKNMKESVWRSTKAAAKA